MADEAIIRIVIEDGGTERHPGGVPPEPAGPSAPGSSNSDAVSASSMLVASARAMRLAVDTLTADISRASATLRQLGTTARPSTSSSAPLALTYSQPAVAAISQSPYQKLQELNKRGNVQPSEIEAILAAAKLTPRERQAYDLAMVQRIPQSGIAGEMGVSHSRPGQLMASVTRKMGFPEALSATILADEQDSHAAVAREGHWGSSAASIEAAGRSTQGRGVKQGRRGFTDDAPVDMLRTPIPERKMRWHEKKERAQEAHLETLQKRYLAESEKDTPDDAVLAELLASITDIPHLAKGGSIEKPDSAMPPFLSAAMLGLSGMAGIAGGTAGLASLAFGKPGEFEWLNPLYDTMLAAGGATVGAGATYLAGGLKDYFAKQDVLPTLDTISTDPYIARTPHRATGGFLDPEDNPDAFMDESDFDIPMASVLDETSGGRGWSPSAVQNAVKPYGAAFEISHHADGGRIDMSRGGTMPNTGRAASGADWHPAWLTDREYVVKAQSAERNRGALEAANANPDVRLEARHHASGGWGGSLVNAINTMTGTPGVKGTPTTPGTVGTPGIVGPELAQMIGTATGPIGQAVAGGIALVGLAQRKFQEAVVGATASVGEFARSLADPDADPSKLFSGAGDTITAGGEKLSKGLNMAVSPLTSMLGLDLFPQLKLVSGVAGEAAKQFGALMQAVDATSKRYGEYSPDIAVADAMVEVQHTMGELRRAQEAGPQLARYLRAQGDLQQRVEDLKIKLLMKIMPAITNIVTIAEKIMPAGDTIAMAITALMAPLNVVTDALARIAGAQEDANRDAIDDPTEVLFREAGPNVGQGVGVPNQ